MDSELDSAIGPCKRQRDPGGEGGGEKDYDMQYTSSHVPLWKIIIFSTIPVVSVATPTLAVNGRGHGSIPIDVGNCTIGPQMTGDPSTMETVNLHTTYVHPSDTLLLYMYPMLC